MNQPERPLVEVFLELKWVPSNVGIAAEEGFVSWNDPGYPLYLGILYGGLRERFPFYQDLPAKAVPDEFSPGLVKAQFRPRAEAWPLVQAGPGVITVNSTTDYTWADFRLLARDVFGKFREAYLAAGVPILPNFTSVVLKYINAATLENHEQQKVFEKIKSTLNVNVVLPTGLGSDGSSEPETTGVDLRMAWRLSTPKGVGSLRIASGSRAGAPAMIWEISVTSQASDVPQGEAIIETWLDEAHAVVASWFSKTSGTELETSQG